ncbi:ribosome recycling factor [Verrucomicrobiales bacterium]|jgi:ribosome recycling factor|nr:ribosome recycling factor [Verrucomicrobiales bacterium]MDB2346338.1 ribosome recycling factor [Verrucomicrobiales bacterium]MDB4589536.1 ribosome recycling factor [Verrucomicrobiales bacterium]MDC0504221.1 ribosome recycling factor [Verrucomicrobiales bacterium]MDF1784519.1 ribosome recycling factor [Verrucomicrobiales bacterium]
MDADTAILETEEGMKKAVGHMVQEFAGVRTGKASPTLVEGIDIHVASYGSSMKLKQLAMITTPEPRLIVVQPFDPSTTQDIERGLKESKLGINPNVDGKNIRLPIPELSEERRRDLVKVVKGMAEDSRVRVRGVRKDGIDKVKKLEKEKEITEDDLRRLEKEIQGLTDASVKQIDEQVSAKEKEIMKV